MNKLKEISFKDRKAIFGRLEQLASQANLTEEERWRLEEDWKNYNDFFNTLDFAKEEGRAEGLEKGRSEGLEMGRAEGLEKGRSEEKSQIAKNLKAMGLSLEAIKQATGLSTEEIEKL